MTLEESQKTSLKANKVIDHKKAELAVEALLSRCHRMRDCDDIAPKFLHGYSSMEEVAEAMSLRTHMELVDVPLLAVQSTDDPLQAVSVFML